MIGVSDTRPFKGTCWGRAESRMSKNWQTSSRVRILSCHISPPLRSSTDKTAQVTRRGEIAYLSPKSRRHFVSAPHLLPSPFVFLRTKAGKTGTHTHVHTGLASVVPVSLSVFRPPVLQTASTHKPVLGTVAKRQTRAKRKRGRSCMSSPFVHYSAVCGGGTSSRGIMAWQEGALVPWMPLNVIDRTSVVPLNLKFEAS